MAKQNYEVRAKKLKLVVPRAAEHKDTRKAIWNTHSLVNEAIGYYESKLLLMRQQGYMREDEVAVNSSQVTQDTLKLARTAQAVNNMPALGADAEILSLLYRVYEEVAGPDTETGSSGKTAQAACRLFSQLTNAETKGCLGVLQVLEHAPEWSFSRNALEVDANLCATALAWIDTDAAEVFIKACDGKTAWKKSFTQGDKVEKWLLLLIKFVKTKQEEKDTGLPEVLLRLRELGVFPLFAPFFGGKSSSVWNKLAFSLAVGHLLSWKSWCLKAVRERKKAAEVCDEYAKRLDEALEAVSLLRQYEQARTKELEQGNLGIQGKYTISRSAVKGWRRLRSAWTKSEQKKDADSLVAKATSLAAGKEFVDPHLYMWLADRANHAVWCNDVDALELLVQANGRASKLERTKGTAVFTPPDARNHPRYSQFEYTSSNFPRYSLSVRGDKLRATFMLLVGGKDPITVEPHEFVVAESGAMRYEVDEYGEIYFTTQQGYRLDPGSADIQFDRKELGIRSDADLASGELGGVFMVVAARVDSQVPAEADPVSTGNGLRFFQYARVTDKKADAAKKLKFVKPGIRLLSVDLGLKDFAHCTIYELSERQHASALCFPVSGREGLYAVKREDIPIVLPGEGTPSTATKRWRDAQYTELFQLRRLIRRFKLYRNAVMAKSDSIERFKLRHEELLAAFATEINSGTVGAYLFPFERGLLNLLRGAGNYPADVYRDALGASLSAYSADVGEAVREWRRRTKKRTNDKRMGKTWSIAYLENVRRLLMGWSHTGTNSDTVYRLDKEKRGQFASHLLQHINHIKRERVALGVRRIIQAATREDYPCDGILLEALDNYTPRDFRSRAENSQLARWSHRAIAEALEKECSLYGLTLLDVSADYSSQFDAKSGAPGVRCHRITEGDLGDTRYGDVAVGELVEYPGGEVFVTLGSEGKPYLVHADANAADNLQQRWWTRHSRVPVLNCTMRENDGITVGVPNTIGKRVQGVLGYGYLQPCSGGDGYTWVSTSARDWEALAELPRAERQTCRFYTDPSGHVHAKDFWYRAEYFWRKGKKTLKK